MIKIKLFILGLFFSTAIISLGLVIQHKYAPLNKNLETNSIAGDVNLINTRMLDLIIQAKNGDTDNVIKLVDYFSQKKIELKGTFLFSYLPDKDDLIRDIAITATKYGNLNIIEAFYAKNYINTMTNELLGDAAENGHYDIVSYLLSKGADVNTSTSFLNEFYEEAGTPLIAAAAAGHTNIIKLLLKNGADINATGSNNHDAMYYAAKNLDENTIKLLINNGANINREYLEYNRPEGNLLLLVIRGGLNNIAEKLIQKGANIHTINDFQQTPLLLAAENGNLKLVNLLIKKGLDINARDKANSNFLHYAAENGNTELIELAVNKGFNINESNDNGITPIINLAKHADIRTFKYLVNKGANIHDQDNDGKTALHSAIQYENISVLKYLIDAGVNINATYNSSNQTPILFAVEINSPKSFKLLLENGVNLNVRNWEGKSIYDLIENNKLKGYKRFDHTEIRHILNEYNRSGVN